MNQDEINSRLERGQYLGLVLFAAQLESSPRLKRTLDVGKKTPDKADLYSWHYLQENPSYVRQQKAIQTKPYVLTLSTLSDVPELLDKITLYFADLDEVDVFLQQFGKSITELRKLSDEDMDL